MFVTSQLFGMLITVAFVNCLGLTCWLAWDTKNTNNEVALKIRRAIIGLIGAQLIEMLLIRAVACSKRTHVNILCAARRTEGSARRLAAKHRLSCREAPPCRATACCPATAWDARTA